MFTQECFIRKNTEQLIYDLYKLGYEYYRPLDSFKNVCTNFGKNIDFDGNESDRYIIDAFDNGYISHFNKIMIDCGTNEELFLAIAALRDDTDRNQWFVHDDSDWNDKQNIFWYKCEEDSIIEDLAYNLMFNDCHKATVQELIEHFKP